MPSIRDPFQSFIDYVLDIKPYHTKIYELLMEYTLEETINVSIDDDHFIDIGINIDQHMDFCLFNGWDIPAWGSFWAPGGTYSMPILEINIGSGYFSIYGNWEDFFAQEQLNASPSSATVIVSSPSSSWTLVTATYNTGTDRTRIYVSESLVGFLGGRISVYKESVWDNPQECLDPITGLPLASGTTIAARFTEETIFDFSDVSMVDLAAVGSFPCESPIFWGGTETASMSIIGGVSPETIYVAGDMTTSLTPVNPLVIAGSTGNNGTYEVASISYNVGFNRTEITIEQTFPSSIFNGILYQYAPISNPSMYGWDVCGWDSPGADNFAETYFTEDLQLSYVDGEGTPLAGSWDGTRWDMDLFSADIPEYHHRSVAVPLTLVNVAVPAPNTFYVYDNGDGYGNNKGAVAAALMVGNQLVVSHSTGNDGIYHVLSFTFTGTQTEIVTVEPLPSSVLDGYVHYVP